MHSGPHKRPTPSWAWTPSVFSTPTPAWKPTLTNSCSHIPRSLLTAPHPQEYLEHSAKIASEGLNSLLLPLGYGKEYAEFSYFLEVSLAKVPSPLRTARPAPPCTLPLASPHPSPSVCLSSPFPLCPSLVSNPFLFFLFLLICPLRIHSNSPLTLHVGKLRLGKGIITVLPQNISVPISETRGVAAMVWHLMDAQLLSLFCCCSFLFCSPHSLPLSVVCHHLTAHFFTLPSSPSPFSLFPPHLLPPHSGSSCLGTLGEPPGALAHTRATGLVVGNGQRAVGSRHWAMGWGQWAEGRRSWQQQRNGKWRVGSQSL